MFKRNMLKVTPLVIVSGLILGGCANKQTWIPELEDARNTFNQISSDPVVSSLAKDELQSATRQLARAETASREYRTPHNIAHEAKLAKLKTLVAQQRARALSANHQLQLAIGQPTLLPEELVLAAVRPPAEEPAIPTMSAAYVGNDSNAELAAQVAALSAQLTQLQAQLTGNLGATEIPAASKIMSPAAHESMMQHNPMQQAPVKPVATPRSAEPQVELSAPTPKFDGEPLLGAAMAASSSERPLPDPSLARLEQQLRAINAKPSSQGMALTLGERYFDAGTARLWTDRAARHLDNVASILNTNPGLTLDIEAHTDNSDSADQSYDLTVNRAISIKSALVLRGIDADRLNAKGFGHSRPIAQNSSALDRMQNRRVELIFANVTI